MELRLVSPESQLAHYAGVLAPAAKLRPLIVPSPLPPSENDVAKPTSKPPTQRCVYIPWALLAKKTFKEEIDRCPKCQGKMKLQALIQEPESIARYLRHLGEPNEPPSLSPARAPPTWKVRELRH